MPMRGPRLYLIIGVIALSLFLIVMVNSCRSGNDPQHEDDVVPVVPSSWVAPTGSR